MVFILFISFVIALRISELILSKRNETWLTGHGAVEYGQKHYPFIVMLHVFFFVSLIVEFTVRDTGFFSIALLIFYFILIAVKGWVVFSLGKFWNTKIYHIPGRASIKKGLYKFIKHPNYLIVILEIALIPLVFQLYYTAIVFTVLNLMVLYVRIKEENKVLSI